MQRVVHLRVDAVGGFASAQEYRRGVQSGVDLVPARASCPHLDAERCHCRGESCREITAQAVLRVVEEIETGCAAVFLPHAVGAHPPARAVEHGCGAVDIVGELSSGIVGIAVHFGDGCARRPTVACQYVVDHGLPVDTDIHRRPRNRIGGERVVARQRHSAPVRRCDPDGRDSFATGDRAEQPGRQACAVDLAGDDALGAGVVVGSMGEHQRTHVWPRAPVVVAGGEDGLVRTQARQFVGAGTDGFGVQRPVGNGCLLDPFRRRDSQQQLR